MNLLSQRPVRAALTAVIIVVEAAVSFGQGNARGVVAREGFIEPAGGIIRVAAPYIDGQQPIVAELYKKEGDHVNAREILALLQNEPLLKAGYERSLAQQKIAEFALAKAQNDYPGARPAGGRKKTSASQLQEPDQEPVQVREARADLAIAASNVKYAQFKWQSSYIKAPTSGCVLAIHAKAGEAVGTQGLLELGNISQLFVTVEVPEKDISRIKKQDTAAIKTDAGFFSNSLTGEVTEISSVVTRESPAHDRIVKVKVKITNLSAKNTAALARYINGRVVVSIPGRP